MRTRIPVLRLKKKSLTVLLAALLLLTALAVGIPTYAKYLRTHRDTGTVGTNRFYFTSNYLSETGTHHALNASADTFSFSVMNYADQYRISELEIAYTVEVTAIDGGSFHLSSHAGTLPANHREEHTITLSDLEPNKTYTIAVTAIGGYQTVIRATVQIAPEERQAFFSIEQTEHYVLLKIRTEQVSGNAVISFPDGLLPDNTDPILQGVTADQSSFTDTRTFVNGYTSYTYRFFKSDPTQSVSAADFSVTVGSVTAQNQQP